MVRKLLLLCLFVPLVQAENVYTPEAHEISHLYFYSKQESIYPIWKGAIQVRFNTISWSDGSNCHNKDVAIREEDSHLISAVLAAKMSKTPIHLFADDTLVVTGNYCYLRAIKL